MFNWKHTWHCLNFPSMNENRHLDWSFLCLFLNWETVAMVLWDFLIPPVTGGAVVSDNALHLLPLTSTLISKFLFRVIFLIFLNTSTEICRGKDVICLYPSAVSTVKNILLEQMTASKMRQLFSSDLTWMLYFCICHQSHVIEFAKTVLRENISLPAEMSLRSKQILNLILTKSACQQFMGQLKKRQVSLAKVSNQPLQINHLTGGGKTDKLQIRDQVHSTRNAANLLGFTNRCIWLRFPKGFLLFWTTPALNSCKLFFFPRSSDPVSSSNPEQH